MIPELSLVLGPRDCLHDALLPYLARNDSMSMSALQQRGMLRQLMRGYLSIDGAHGPHARYHVLLF